MPGMFSVISRSQFGRQFAKRAARTEFRDLLIIR